MLQLQRVGVSRLRERGGPRGRERWGGPANVWVAACPWRWYTRPCTRVRASERRRGEKSYPGMAVNERKGARVVRRHAGTRARTWRIPATRSRRWIRLHRAELLQKKVRRKTAAVDWRLKNSRNIIIKIVSTIKFSIFHFKNDIDKNFKIY